MFLSEAAVRFLRYTGGDKGNRLEIELYRKLLDVNELTQLRADALMYYHVYADLVTLSKSNELNKSVMDMNQHYLELYCFLGDVEKDPSVVMNENYAVFKSEKSL